VVMYVKYYDLVKHLEFTLIIGIVAELIK